MTRTLARTILWLCVAGVMGAGLFLVKHSVNELESKLASVNHEIQRTEDDIHVLNAEWSYLNDPVRLSDLASRYLGMKQMGPSQVARIDTLAAGGAAFAQLDHTPSTRAVTQAAVSGAPAVAVITVPAVKPAPAETTLTPQSPLHRRSVSGTGLAMATTGEAR